MKIASNDEKLFNSNQVLAEIFFSLFTELYRGNKCTRLFIQLFQFLVTIEIHSSWDVWKYLLKLVYLTFDLWEFFLWILGMVTGLQSQRLHVCLASCGFLLALFFARFSPLLSQAPWRHHPCYIVNLCWEWRLEPSSSSSSYLSAPENAKRC